MKSVEIVARSVEEAIEEGLKQLDVTRDEVEISVIEEGTKGFLGILGSRQAKVCLTIKPNITWKVRIAEEYVTNIIDLMKLDAKIDTVIEDDNIKVNITGEQLGLLIGRRGKTLDALQFLTSMVVNREGGEWARVIIDVEAYRQRREQTLRSLARRLASKAESTGRRVALDPMNALERRIVHSELQDFGGVETHSEGKDPYRRVIIVPKR